MEFSYKLIAQRKLSKIPNIWKYNILVNKPCVKEEIKIKIRSYFDLNNNLKWDMANAVLIGRHIALCLCN